MSCGDINKDFMILQDFFKTLIVKFASAGVSGRRPKPNQTPSLLPVRKGGLGVFFSKTTY